MSFSCVSSATPRSRVRGGPAGSPDGPKRKKNKPSQNSSRKKPNQTNNNQKKKTKNKPTKQNKKKTPKKNPKNPNLNKKPPKTAKRIPGTASRLGEGRGKKTLCFKLAKKLTQKRKQCSIPVHGPRRTEHPEKREIEQSPRRSPRLPAPPSGSTLQLQ